MVSTVHVSDNALVRLGLGTGQDVYGRLSLTLVRENARAILEIQLACYLSPYVLYRVSTKERNAFERE